MTSSLPSVSGCVRANQSRFMSKPYRFRRCAILAAIGVLRRQDRRRWRRQDAVHDAVGPRRPARTARAARHRSRSPRRRARCPRPTGRRRVGEGGLERSALCRGSRRVCRFARIVARAVGVHAVGVADDRVADRACRRPTSPPGPSRPGHWLRRRPPGTRRSRRRPLVTCSAPKSKSRGRSRAVGTEASYSGRGQERIAGSTAPADATGAENETRRARLTAVAMSRRGTGLLLRGAGPARR